jgi:hypothetical protein
MSELRIGVIGLWEDASFDAADTNRNIVSAYESRRVVLDSVSTSPRGGTWQIDNVRGYREFAIGMNSWDLTTFGAFDGYLDKYRVDPALWLLDPSDVRHRENVLFGAVPPDGYSGIGHRGPDHVRDFTVNVMGVPMGPE